MKFEQTSFSTELKRNLKRLNFNRPTDIQFKCLKPILNGDDVLAIAQTGTGKTGAFVIPLIDIIHKRKMGFRKDGIKCLVMVPTHELAIQIFKVIQELGSGTRIKAGHIHGGVEQADQIETLDDGVDFLVATPGRLFDLVHQQHLNLNRVETLVIDEADQMLERGFYKDIQDLLRFLPKKRQTLFFSATIDQKIKTLAYALVNKPVKISISPKNPVSTRVEHFVADVPMDDKRFFLERLVRENESKKILVFVRTKVRCERVFKAMERVDIKSMVIHGDKDQAERNDALSKFASGEVSLLIATDVSARGIDIPGINLVVNYDLPEFPDNYVHRVGRTGRGSQNGKAVSFCSEEEKPLLKAVEDYIGQSIAHAEVSRDDRKDTLMLTQDYNHDLNALLEEDERLTKLHRKRKGKKQQRK